jgi:hypothetical protein
VMSSISTLPLCLCHCQGQGHSRGHTSACLRSLGLTTSKKLKTGFASFPVHPGGTGGTHPDRRRQIAGPGHLQGFSVGKNINFVSQSEDYKHENFLRCSDQD